MFHTVSIRELSNMPNFIPADSIGEELRKFSNDELYKLNDKINKEHGTPSEGAVNFAHALLLPLAFPELQYLWIVEDDFVFDGDSIKQFVDFHSNEDADYMAVELSKYKKKSLWEGWTALEPLRFDQSTWSRSFAPVMRVSAQFVRHVLDEMLEHDFCFFESFFPTVANYYGLKTKQFDARFTKNVRWLPEWTEEEMSRAKEGQVGSLSIFHPFKANQVQIIPACRAEPAPDQTPDPTADPTPDQPPDQTPDQTPDPTADPTADPTPDPTPDQTPDQTPDPTPDQTPDQTPDPTPDPPRGKGIVIGKTQGKGKDAPKPKGKGKDTGKGKAKSKSNSAPKPKGKGKDNDTGKGKDKGKKGSSKGKSNVEVVHWNTGGKLKSTP
jgi:hypothetical protein